MAAGVLDGRAELGLARLGGSEGLDRDRRRAPGRVGLRLGGAAIALQGFVRLRAASDEDEQQRAEGPEPDGPAWWPRPDHDGQRPVGLGGRVGELLRLVVGVERLALLLRSRRRGRRRRCGSPRRAPIRRARAPALRSRRRARPRRARRRPRRAPPRSASSSARMAALSSGTDVENSSTRPCLKWARKSGASA